MHSNEIIRSRFIELQRLCSHQGQYSSAIERLTTPSTRTGLKQASSLVNQPVMRCPEPVEGTIHREPSPEDHLFWTKEPHWGNS
jgi:hypothetical protein